MRAGWRSVDRAGLKDAIHLRVAKNDLHVLAGFGERNGFHEFRNVVVFAFGLPELDAIFAGIVGGEGGFWAAELFEQVVHVESSEREIVLRIEKARARIAKFLAAR